MGGGRRERTHTAAQLETHAVELGRVRVINRDHSRDLHLAAVAATDPTTPTFMLCRAELGYQC